ncbi:MAG TPA: hypothetical protein PKC54_08130 [Ferruginibacter sp.]|nr:hypothetical protein [Ferruginibacter sp.]
MKKILIATNLLLLTVTLFMACDNSRTTESATTATGGTETRAAAGPDVSEEMYGLLDDSLAVLMSEAYRDDNRKSKVTGSNGELDARSIWFDLETIKLFIAKIEASVAGAEKCDSFKLGIRMYYAKYPEGEEFNKYSEALSQLGPGIAGKHTLFMTPTYYNNGENIDFNFEEVGDDRCKPIPYSKLLRMNNRAHKSGLFIGRKKPAPIADPRETGQSTHTVNHGGLMPPPASGGTFPTGGQ